MDKSKLKTLRSNALFKELVAEAISNLDNDQLSSLDVAEVICSKGVSDAKVYIDASLVNTTEKKETLRMLKKARHSISSYCQSKVNKRVPNFTFFIDEHLDSINNIEKIFAKINESKSNELK